MYILYTAFPGVGRGYFYMTLKGGDKMKMNTDCMEKILFALEGEKDVTAYGLRAPNITQLDELVKYDLNEAFSKDQVAYSCYLLMDLGLILAEMSDGDIEVTRLTYRGHSVLQSIRNGSSFQESVERFA